MKISIWSTDWHTRKIGCETFTITHQGAISWLATKYYNYTNPFCDETQLRYIAIVIYFELGMVLFQNLSLNQEVEVLHLGCLFSAKVRYLGSLALRRGDWVGLELYQPVGDSDGMYRARRYFFARRNFGLFTTADRVRFKPLPCHIKNNYRQLDKHSSVDEELFGSWTRSVEKPEFYDVVSTCVLRQKAACLLMTDV